MSPDLLRLHLEPSPGLHLNVVITDQHPVTDSAICDEVYRFSRFIVDDIKLSPAAASRLKELQIDVHSGYPSLGFLVPAFDGSLPKLQSLRL